MAVRTPTDAASRARSLAVAAAVPQNMHVAAFYASLEWWRVKALALEESKDAFSVLSLSNGSPDYDREVSNLLKSRRPNLRYTVVEPTGAHSRLQESATVTVSKAASLAAFAEEYAAARAKAGAGAGAGGGAGSGGGKKKKGKRKGGKGEDYSGFDLVHVALWRNQDWADTLSVVHTAAGLLKPNGTLVVFANGQDGLFKLREKFADRLGAPTPGAASLPQETLLKSLEAAGMDSQVEVLRSLVDVSALCTFTPSTLVNRTLSLMLLCDMEKASATDPTILSEVTSAMLDTSVASHPERCVVYTPLHVIIGTKSSSAPFFPPKPAQALLMPKVDPWWPHGEKGGFFNLGLQNWLGVRKAWKRYDVDATRQPKPPLVGLEDVVEGLSKLRRTYNLPAPMSLSDILDIFIDIWDDEELR